MTGDEHAAESDKRAECTYEYIGKVGLCKTST